LSLEPQFLAMKSNPTRRPIPVVVRKFRKLVFFFTPENPRRYAYSSGGWPWHATPGFMVWKNRIIAAFSCCADYL